MAMEVMMYNWPTPRHDDIEYWKECLTRIDPDDVFALMMVQGKIKQLIRENQDDN